ncbi:MAG: hypothetical protein WC284_07780 [Candidimonas sp.]
MGGNVFPNTDVVHIDDIPKIIDIIREYGLNITVDDLLGSAGKKQISGDIDVAIDENRYNLNDLHEILKRGPFDVKKFDGLNMISMAVPIKDKYVQVDLITGNYKWMKFAMFSPSENESSYKGLYRTEMIRASLSSLGPFKIDNDGSLLAKISPIMYLTDGVHLRYRMRPIGRYGNRLKGIKNVSKEEFELNFPNLTWDGATLPSYDPLYVLRMVFDVNTIEECNTAESVHNLISRLSDDRINLIQTIYRSILVNKGVRIFEELMWNS